MKIFRITFLLFLFVSCTKKNDYLFQESKVLSEKDKSDLVSILNQFETRFHLKDSASLIQFLDQLLNSKEMTIEAKGFTDSIANGTEIFNQYEKCYPDSVVEDKYGFNLYYNCHYLDSFVYFPHNGCTITSFLIKDQHEGRNLLQEFEYCIVNEGIIWEYFMELANSNDLIFKMLDDKKSAGVIRPDLIYNALITHYPKIGYENTLLSFLAFIHDNK